MKNQNEQKIGCGMNFIEKQRLSKAISEGNEVVIIDSKGEYTKLVEMLGGKIVNIDASKGKPGWINPVTGESSQTEELRNRAKKAIKSRKYRKAYRLLRKAKALILHTI